MDFARRRQRQPALGSINLGFIAAIICLRIFERDARRGRDHRWVEGVEEEKKRKIGRKGKAIGNRQFIAL